MENSLQIQQIELFLEEVIIRELGKMQEIEISYMPFVLMGSRYWAAFWTINR